jgi:hypothetical protein
MAYNPVPLGIQSMDPLTGKGGGGFCTPQLVVFLLNQNKITPQNMACTLLIDSISQTPFGEKDRSACFDRFKLARERVDFLMSMK